MKKRISIVSIIMIFLFLLSGCRNTILPDLPKDAIAFEIRTFEDTKHDIALFGSIEYNGRVYIPFGTINNSYRQNLVDSCIGYIIQDENSSSVVDPDNKDRRIYIMKEDDEHNFLMEYDDTVKLMNQPDFYRAIDTDGKDIVIPDYISSFGYAFWK